jgi:hypothetical protein
MAAFMITLLAGLSGFLAIRLHSPAFGGVGKLRAAHSRRGVEATTSAALIVTDRAEFMIDGFRVRHEFGGGSRCVCAEFAASGSCKHTREVAGRLAAQGRIAEHLKRGSSNTLAGRGLVPPGPRRRMR